MKITDEKIKALSKYLGLPKKQITQCNYNSNLYITKLGEYLVITPDEREQALADRIREDLWAYNVDFILDFCGAKSSDKIVAALKNMQDQLAEDANEIVYLLIGGDDKFGEFISEVLKYYGAAQLLVCYGGDEVVTDNYYIYRRA